MLSLALACRFSTRCMGVALAACGAGAVLLPSLLGAISASFSLHAGMAVPWPPSPGRLRIRLKKAGLPVKEKYIVTPTEAGPRSFHHGFEATQRLLAVKPRIDGIFCFNDPLAIGALEAVLAAGLRIPEDVAIIGCSNHPLGEALRLPLSTIDQDTKALGEKSAKAVLSLLTKSGSPAPSRKIVLKPRLIVRATSQRLLAKSARKQTK